MNTLTMNVTRDGGVPILSVIGDLDLGSRAWLADFVEGVTFTDPRLVLDLRRVRLCDAASMTMFIRIAELCRTRGGWLRLACPRGLVGRVLAVFAFGRLVPTYGTVAAAVTGDETQRIKD